MPRQRRQPSKQSKTDSTAPLESPVAQESNEGTTNYNPVNNVVTKERVRMAEVLSSEQITELLANTRGRGEYAEYLKEFIDSGEPGIKVDLESGTLAGKSVDKAYTGLNNARTGINTVKDADGNVTSTSPKVPGADKVKVVRAPDKSAVFLINRALVEGSGE